MTYHRRLTEHLANYKSSVLGVRENGLWENVERDHILPLSLSRQNIVPLLRDDFWRYVQEQGLPSRLHRDFHHLNSSQAFAFNLFFAVFGDVAATNAILDLVEIEPQSVVWEFEAVPKPKERTNFDVLGTCAAGPRLHVEVKLSEREFGKCSMATAKKTRDIFYRDALAGKIPDAYLDDAMFAKNYQLLRNLSHLCAGDRLLLVVPRLNSDTFSQATKFREAVLPEWRNSVFVAAAEDLIQRLAVVSPRLSAIMTEVEQKYVCG